MNKTITLSEANEKVVDDDLLRVGDVTLDLGVYGNKFYGFRIEAVDANYYRVSQVFGDKIEPTIGSKAIVHQGLREKKILTGSLLNALFETHG